LGGGLYLVFYRDKNIFMKSWIFSQKIAVIGGLYCSMLLHSLFLTNPFVSAQPLTSQPYQQVTPLLEKIDLEQLQINDNSRFNDPAGKNCVTLRPNLCIAIGSNSNRPSSDRGIQLFMIEKVHGRSKIRYQSKGSGDAYNLSPNFYRHPTNGSWMILAELGTEYSWGARAFTFKQDVMTDIGYLNVAVGGKQDNPSSVLPYTIITQEDGETVFRFTKDVVTDPGGDAEFVDKSRIRYIYDSQTLKAIIEPRFVAERRQFPDKIIASKKIRGRFIKTLWGDYLYALE
jgi:hypothetical protein